MWKRIARSLRCPICEGALSLHEKAAEDVDLDPQDVAAALARGIDARELTRWVEWGAFTCGSCSLAFPIARGLPVMIPYTTPIHAEWNEAHGRWLASLGAFRFPALEPVSGEQFVMRSFSTEWLEYDYDGVIWDLSYEDHEERFLAEIGPRAAERARHGTFLEIGCGIGLTTYFAAKDLECDAIGVDLSLAALRATQHFRRNPFLHFVQASAFRLPLPDGVADLVYSHGVLHHTYSTKAAVRSVARTCRESGWMYIWLYGSGSLGGSPARTLAFALERALRPRIARNLESLRARTALGAFACAYIAVNAIHRLQDRTVERYEYKHALHAARDRFTPLYAHRHDFGEVDGWFRDLGFVDRELVDWRSMPTANQPNYRRNTGVRGIRAGVQNLDTGSPEIVAFNRPRPAQVHAHLAHAAPRTGA